MCHLLALLGAHHILHVSRIRVNKHLYCIRRILLGKPDGKRSLGRPSRKWEDNIKMDLQEVGFGVMGWIHLAQDRDSWRALLNAVLILRGSIHCGEFLD
jgi:hypothetical protein